LPDLSRRAPGAWILAALLSLLLLASLEGALRLATRLPTGRFRFLVRGQAGPYPPGETLEMTWGPVAYTVHANRLGFRGREIEPVPADGCVRLLAIGDSMTNGYFVDDDATYPSFLERRLAEAMPCVEVVNGARGGGSIDEELAILKSAGLALRPHVVLLAFMTNDIAEIRGRTTADLLSVSARKERPPRAGRGMAWVLVHTAIGEWVADRYLGARYERYGIAGREAPRATPVPSRDGRYAIDGGDEYDRNVRAFQRRFGGLDSDGAVLSDASLRRVRPAIDAYLGVLREFHAACMAGGARLVFVYLPAYPQIYDPSCSVEIRDLLRDACAGEGIPFVDVLPEFRRRGRDAVYHLAPVDFHPNPAGNRLIADAIAAELLARDLLPRDADAAPDDAAR